MPHMISSWSVADGVSPLVSKSKLVYGIFIYVDNKVKWICLLTLVTVSVRPAQVIPFMSRVPHHWGEKRKANGAHETINHFVRSFAKYPPILKILSAANRVINL